MDSSYQYIIQAAQQGGKVLKKYFGKELEIIEKSSHADIQTKADIESERTILKTLEKHFPAYNIISEEKGSVDKKSDYTFVIDPLDGSSNFVHSVPYFSVSIGLLQEEKIVVGVVYDPIRDTIYWAERGKGSFGDGKRLKVNKVPVLESASLSYACSYTGSLEYNNNIIRTLYEKGVKRVFEHWSLALDFCLLASGKLEAVITNGNPIHDFAAGKLIAKEAGALVTDFHGREEKSEKNSIFLASNGSAIHREILKIL